MGAWTQDRPHCLLCEGDESPHHGYGLCEVCYRMVRGSMTGYASQARYNERNRDRVRARKREYWQRWYAKHKMLLPDRYPSIKEWRKQNPDKIAMYNRNYRARQRGEPVQGDRVEVLVGQYTLPGQIVKGGYQFDGERVCDIRLDKTGNLLAEVPLTIVRITQDEHAKTNPSP